MPAFEIICMDIYEYELPLQPLLPILANPFGPSVMEKVCARVVKSLTEHPRGVRIVYLYPKCDDVMMNAIEVLRRVSQSSLFNVRVGSKLKRGAIARVIHALRGAG